MEAVLGKVVGCAPEAEPAVVADVWLAAYPDSTPAVAAEAAPLLAARLGASGDAARRVCMVAAELAKEEDNRDVLGAALVEPLVQVVKRATEARDRLTRHQALRALGNLCYEHNDNRTRVLECGGVTVILQSVAIFQQELEVFFFKKKERKRKERRKKKKERR